jgi:hypothetical protein
MSTPSAPDPLPPAPPPVIDDGDEDEKLARQRRALDKRRTGRRALRIDPPTTSGSGIQIPKG